ncbi:cyclic nucleotide-binding domain-containing protein [Listeria ivanovii]|uniref:Crp/Fnr family transcriptional regulator n=1 Tax=Listeria ivanovii subsp. londoniensis TaxID=202752 RepID=A0ABS1G3B4_LISIV|nr:Crp/Fnr family transcriptional regulator [Listeria ivanovii]AIS60272.1 transcriptional regulator [Listeria ivanovii subsp. londoniensis]MBK1961364.1 Crp/Fnr family transcriptional regulator [Listeria ivanovii subsp. londoniensis]MBM5608345.1 Crp/Fnr family transcriptional regulator [Listeria ivanovii]MBM5636388.1 Crp/Fnr family transcriptional regulator [Listeria ivanovii]MBM5705762.1 Crp/Fnr family transcriptional regulator [Listeria ivanovii]
MYDTEVKEMVDDLEFNKLEDAWIRTLNFTANEQILHKQFIDEFIIVKEGVLHIENNGYQILRFFTSGDIINQQIAVISEDKELQIICDTDVSVVFINREYFLNFASNKTSYLKWLLNATLTNNKNLYKELFKNDLPEEERIVTSLKMLCDKLKVESESGLQKIPSYLNKTKIAKYAGVFRKELNEDISVLIRKELLDQRRGALYVKNKVTVMK